MDHGLSARQIEIALGAGLAVAKADGDFEQTERRTLSATAATLGRADLAIDALAVPTPAELAEAFGDATLRERVIQGLLVIALMDGAIAKEELGCIREYAEALRVDEPRLETMRHLANGHRRLVYFDLWRRSAMLEDAVRAAWEKKGTRGLWRFFGGFAGVEQDPRQAWRFKKLGLLPEGSFGRAYWAHMTERELAFPGEHSGFPEELAKHDLVHVLGGYDTDPVGECEVIGFIAGFMKHDPFGYLFQILVHMQLGVHVFDGSPTERMVVPPERVLAAIERGGRVTRDLYDPSWDFWTDLHLPLDEVRAKYGIAPKTGS